MNLPVQAKHSHRYTFTTFTKKHFVKSIISETNMSLLIRVFFLAAVVWLLYRAYIRWQTGNRSDTPPQDALQTVARCEGCGVYLPVQTLSPQGRCGACEQKRP
jgi:hypothetical protein